MIYHYPKIFETYIWIFLK